MAHIRQSTPESGLGCLICAIQDSQMSYMCQTPLGSSSRTAPAERRVSGLRELRVESGGRRADCGGWRARGSRVESAELRVEDGGCRAEGSGFSLQGAATGSDQVLVEKLRHAVRYDPFIQSQLASFD